MIIKAEAIQSADDIKEVIEKHGISFFDFGCSRGSNISHVNRRTGLSGMGFDINEKKLIEADGYGHIVSDLNILNIPDEKLVDHGHFSHVLEHLTNIDEVQAFIEKSCRICKKQVLIKQPFVDTDLFLFQLGLKSGYSHWKGHKTNLTTPVLFNLLNDLKKSGLNIEFMIYYNKPIIDSDYKKMFSINADIDSVDYNAEKDMPKPKVRFNFPHFHQINAVIFIDGNDDKAYDKISKPNVIMYDSRSGYINDKIYINEFSRNSSMIYTLKRIKNYCRTAAASLYHSMKRCWQKS